MPRTKPVRVLVTDDHPLFREGVIAALHKAVDIEVVGEARNGEEAVIQATNLHPDVVLMDLDMPTMDGVTAIRILIERFSSLKILILSAYGDNQHVYEAMKAGAVGYVIKRTNQASLVKVIRSAHQGEVLISPYLAHLTLKDLEVSSTQSGIRLTEREKEVLHLIIEGYENDAIAQALSMSQNTVKFHLKHIFERLRVKNRTQAAVTVLKKGIISQ